MNISTDGNATGTQTRRDTRMITLMRAVHVLARVLFSSHRRTCCIRVRPRHLRGTHGFHGDAGTGMVQLALIISTMISH